MLKSITMRNVATYGNEGVTFDELNKVNLIFGPNGTGKTTISNFLTHYSKNRSAGVPIPDKFTDCQIQWDRDESPEIIVYNRAFKKDNIGNTSIPGVFVMGKNAIDNKDKIEELQNKITDINTELERQTSALQDTQDSYIYNGRIYQTSLADADEKLIKDAKEIYAKILDRLIRNNDNRIATILQYYSQLNTATILSEEEIKRNISIANEKSATQIPTIIIPDTETFKTTEQDNIWTKAIIGSGDIDFAGFINSLGISDWIRQGINKIEEAQGVCPFCQQHVATNDLIDKFNGYFNEDYEKDIEKVEELITSYKGAAIELENFFTNLINDANYTEYIDAKVLNDIYDDLHKHYKLNITSMTKKATSPSDRILLDDGTALYERLEDFVADINTAISKRNALIINKNQLKANLPHDVWYYLVNKYKTQIADFDKKRNAAKANEVAIQKQIDALTNEKNRLMKEISNLQSLSSDSTAVVVRINNILERLQFNSFRLECYGTDAYRIVRQNGDTASQTLSEGEETLISFLYYIHLLDGNTDATQNKRDVIAVIDDPISSLDNSVLTFVAREVKDLMYRSGDNKDNIKQVIILTHSINFHKSLSMSAIAYDKNRVKKTFYSIDKDLSSHHAYLKSKTLENKVESEYTTLWKLLKETMQKLGSAEDDSKKTYKYTIQNTMRRIYETFFTNTCGLSNYDITEMFQNAGKGDCINDFRNLTDWLNEGSHSADMNDFKDVPSDAVIVKHLETFRDTFEVTGNLGQFERLLG
jgi:wobble nucleotide-excising tRNase